MAWVPAIMVATALLAAIALWIAVRTNGPAVLDSIDRLTSGDRQTALVESAEFGPSPAQKLAVYAPAQGSAPLPVLLFIHGGSWSSGNPDDYGFVARALVPEGFIVVVAGYRLFPEARFPAMLEDAAGAVAWTRANAARLGGDPARIVLVGHSAGAYNAVMTALDGQWLANEGLGTDAVAGVIGLAGPYDFYPFTSEGSRNSFGHVADAGTTQPVNFANDGAPPMLLLHGETDTTVRIRNSRALADALGQVGVKVQTRYYPDLGHNDLVIALASPWRERRPILAEMTKFARSLQPSVPVQGETR